MSKLGKLGKTLSLAQKTTKAVKGFAAAVEISSGTINALLKLSGLKNTDFGQSLSEVLFYLELLSLGAELTVGLGKRLSKAVDNVLEHKEAYQSYGGQSVNLSQS